MIPLRTATPRGRHRVLRGFAKTSLRTRVLLLAVGLLAVGLTGSSICTITLLRTYLDHRVDLQLRTTAQVFQRISPNMPLNPATTAGAGETPGLGLFGDHTVTFVNAGGAVQQQANMARNRSGGGPVLPRLDATAVSVRKQHPFTVTSRDGREHWRAIAMPQKPEEIKFGSKQDRGSVIVATPLQQVDDMVVQMRIVSVITGSALLAVLTVVGWFAVRSGLRSLSRIEETAAAIAGGDLSRRVPGLGAPGTEIGRLGRAFNGMLVQIETAFAMRAESEARMGRFVADASHELRTPLVGIKGFTDLYRMGALPEQQDIDRTMTHIARESGRLARLVEDMLLLARLDERSLSTCADNGPGGALPLELAPMDLRTLAADALHDVRALDPTRPVRLTGPDGTAPSSALALADEARLRQVVTNLVGNAVAHTPTATPIRIGVGTLGEYAVLEVADQGQGLTEEQGNRIFERFYRADGSRSRTTGGGAGLGLAIVQSLVAAHGGQVELRSAPGQGATFRVLLPCLTDCDQNTAEVPLSPDRAGGRRPHLAASP